MTPILEAKGLKKRFGGITAVSNVSFNVFPGECIALAGDNGAGKSTVIKMISGVFQPTEGEVFFKAHRFPGNPPKRCAMPGSRRSIRTWHWRTISIRASISISAASG